MQTFTEFDTPRTNDEWELPNTETWTFSQCKDELISLKFHLELALSRQGRNEQYVKGALELVDQIEGLLHSDNLGLMRKGIVDLTKKIPVLLERL